MNKQPSYEELVKKINELEFELKTTKKYGLVWDKENTKEKVVLDCESKIPVLEIDQAKSIITPGGGVLIISL